MVSDTRLWATRTPSEPVPDFNSLHPRYGDGFAERLCNALKEGPFKDLYERQLAMVLKLDDLANQIARDAVDRQLIISTCKDCEPYSRILP